MEPIRLCAEDTTPEDIEGLVARGFVLIPPAGFYANLVSLIEPSAPIDDDTDEYSNNRTMTYANGVRIRIVREKCMCSSYHKEPKPGAFDYSQVALDGVFGPPPQQREKTDEERAESERQLAESVEYVHKLQKRADEGDGRAIFMLRLRDMQRDVQKAQAEEMMRVIRACHERQQKFMDSLPK